MATFTKDVEEIRQRAMQKIEEGAVTDSYKLDKEKVIEILNEALATEIVCVLRYQHHYFMATGVHGRSVAELFKEHADEEREHSDEIAERIQQLGGKPNFNPGDLVQRSVSQYVEGETLADMIREDLIAERMVIDVYQRMIEYFGTKDPTTRVLIEHIKGEEEEHASELSDMMFIVNPETGEDEGQDPGTNPLNRREERAQQPIATERKSSQGQQSSKQNSSSRNEVEEEGEEGDDTIEETSTRDWGNETNVGKRGKGSPVRTSTAPKDSSWGNEQNASKSGSSGRKGDDRLRTAVEKERSGSKGGSQESSRSGNDRKNTNITNRSRDERVTPKSPRAGDSRDGKTPGASGRPMNRRRNESVDVDDVAERPNRGASMGTNRSPRILQKNRKSKRAA
jgi:bacterioferritin